MKTKIKTFLYGVFVTLYSLVNATMYYITIMCFKCALVSSGIVTIGYFILSILFAVCAVVITYNTKKNIKIKGHKHNAEM